MMSTEKVYINSLQKFAGKLSTELKIKTDILSKDKADKSNTYTKKEVDDLIKSSSGSAPTEELQRQIDVLKGQTQNILLSTNRGNTIISGSLQVTGTDGKIYVGEISEDGQVAVKGDIPDSYTKSEVYNKSEVDEGVTALYGEIEKGRVKQIFSGNNNTYPLLIGANHSMIDDHKTWLSPSYYSDKVVVNPSIGELYLRDDSDNQVAVGESMSNLSASKADKSDTYTKAEVDALTGQGGKLIASVEYDSTMMSKNVIFPETAEEIIVVGSVPAMTNGISYFQFTDTTNTNYMVYFPCKAAAFGVYAKITNLPGSILREAESATSSYEGITKYALPLLADAKAYKSCYIVGNSTSIPSGAKFKFYKMR